MNDISPDRISRVVRGYFLAIRAMDADAFANSFAEDGTTYDPVGSPGITGRAAIRDFLISIAQNFKSVSLTEDSVFVAGKYAYVADENENQLVIVDISNSAAPFVAQNIDRLLKTVDGELRSEQERKHGAR